MRRGCNAPGALPPRPRQCLVHDFALEGAYKAVRSGRAECGLSCRDKRENPKVEPECFLGTERAATSDHRFHR
jgi:hypothetical protein